MSENEGRRGGRSRKMEEETDGVGGCVKNEREN
jgi:hypothetical protein